jgi:serine/threonine protein phosphatase 1
MQMVYAIGDIHGSLQQLRSLVKIYRGHAAGRPAKFVFIGDYIDRGPDSRGVVEFLMDLQSRDAARAVCLMGNHEALALSAFAREADVAHWIYCGGDATLRSYGAAGVADIPADHIKWLRSLPLVCDDGRRFFVHAGINPRKPLDKQKPNDLLWIREPFLSDQQDYGKLVVHGHTPTRDGMPDMGRSRLNIDTGAAFGGPLTAAVFIDDQRDPINFIQVRN